MNPLDASSVIGATALTGTVRPSSTAVRGR